MSKQLSLVSEKSYPYFFGRAKVKKGNQQQQNILVKWILSLLDILANQCSVTN